MKAHGTVAHLLRTPLVTTTDGERAEGSWWVYGEIGRYFDPEDGSPTPVYAITVLSVLHRLTGFVMRYEGEYRRSR